MSAAISPVTGKAYGVQRVCCAWEMPRSSFYDRVARKVVPLVARKRGPKTPLSDDEVLTLIRTDLETSPFIGEGHRKVWGRLRFVKGINVGRIFGKGGFSNESPRRKQRGIYLIGCINRPKGRRIAPSEI